MKGFAPKITQQAKSKVDQDPSGLPCLLGQLTYHMCLTPFLCGSSRGSACGWVRGTHQVEGTLHRVVQQTGGTLGRLPLYLTHCLTCPSPTNIIKFKTNITVKVSC